MHAHGLTLEEVAYPADDELAAQAAAARVVRTLPAARPAATPGGEEPADG